MGVPSEPSEPSEPAESARPSVSSRLVYWLPVIGAPIGMGVAIFASFAIAGWRVTHSAIVQVEPHWVAGEPVAARVQVLDGDDQAVPDAQVEVTLRRGDERAPLGTLRDAARVGTAQGRLVPPPWPPGPAQLELEIAAHEAFRETVEVELVAARAPRRGTPTVSGSTKNYADDTEPQPEALRIVLRPLGRLVAGFENALVARVTTPEGLPHRGPVEVRLLDGEFGPHKAGRDAPALVTRAETDAAGLVRVDGLLATDVVRFEVRALAGTKDMSDGEGPKGHGDAGMSQGAGKGAAKQAAKAEAAKGEAAGGEGEGPGAAKDEAAKDEAVLAARKFRMVSFAGAVTVDAGAWTAGVGDTLTIKARGLRPKRAVFVDVRGPDGAWVDTLEPPVIGLEPPRAWSSAGLQPGLLQLEAYHFTNAPGESAALARVALGPGPGQGPTLASLIALQRERLSMPRVEKGFDAALEGKYLDALAAASLDPDSLRMAEAWLIGTLPVEIHGPPLALTTRGREDAEMAALRRLWAGRVRWLLLGGGGLFLAVTTLLIVVSHRRAAARLTVEMLGQGPEVAAEVRKAQRAVLLRALGLLVSMALGLALTAAVLDKLFWQT